MQCRKCETELSNDDITATVAVHDDALLDIIVECPECGHVINTFVDMTEAVDL